jgi:proteasome accessory factor A
MQESLFGIETEYAFTHFAPGGKALKRAAGLETMLAFAPERLKCLNDSGAPGFYLSNGSRLYIDVGHHPELSTPECLDPWEAVRYILAGERILAMLAAEVERKHPGSKASVYRCNVDYITGQTWGCHESYLHRTTTEALAEEIIPHLVSRLIYTGAGGFDNHSSGLEFTLSPRAPHLGKGVSGHSTHDRGIFHTKDEPLCANGYHRLHILCGESQCSQLGTFLKIGATALVVRMIEAGVCRGREMALRAPPTAMRRFASDPSCTRFASDPSCTRREALRNGKKLSALEIQRHYLEAAEAHVSREFMPTWAGEVCAEWRRMLDRLEGGEGAVSTVLDWGIKLTLFREHARKRPPQRSAARRCSRICSIQTCRRATAASPKSECASRSCSSRGDPDRRRSAPSPRCTPSCSSSTRDLASWVRAGSSLPSMRPEFSTTAFRDWEMSKRRCTNPPPGAAPTSGARPSCATVEIASATLRHGRRSSTISSGAPSTSAIPSGEMRPGSLVRAPGGRRKARKAAERGCNAWRGDVIVRRRRWASDSAESSDGTVI